jgi:hypothetical protein
MPSKKKEKKRKEKKRKEKKRKEKKRKEKKERKRKFRDFMKNKRRKYFENALQQLMFPLCLPVGLVCGTLEACCLSPKYHSQTL